MYRFCTVSEIYWDIGWKSPILTYPTSICRTRWSPSWNFAKIFSVRKLESLGYRIRRCLHDPRFSCLGRTQTCDGRTDKQTQDDSIHCASITSHSKNYQKSIHKCHSKSKLKRSKIPKVGRFWDRVYLCIFYPFCCMSNFSNVMSLIILWSLSVCQRVTFKQILPWYSRDSRLAHHSPFQFYSHYISCHSTLYKHFTSSSSSSSSK